MEDPLADVAHTLVFDALTRAATAPAGVPLYTAKAARGLFAATAAGKSAAQRCKDEGLLQPLRSETKGKASQEVCGITEKGLALLLEHANPRPVLEAFVEALHERHVSLQAIQAGLQQSQQELAEFRAVALRVFERLGPAPSLPSPAPNGAFDISAALRTQLLQWHEAGLLGDCPLPELFRRLRAACADVTIGQFHDHLRLLHQAQQIYLHPWTGPLYELPEPSLALLVGHEIAFYASLRM
jgi:hypothetical protein